jgi:transcriptional regulator with XRE-family HTH domain
MSDPAILAVLGTFIQQTRLQQNKTQQQVAAAAGVNRSTLVQIENTGGGTLLSFIQILRALEQLQLFQHFEVKQQQLSPLQLAKIDQKKRQRASNKKAALSEKPKSDW